MIEFKINEATFHVTEEDVAMLIFAAVPEFMRNANVAAPSETLDLIRGAVKSMMALAGNKLLFEIYGAQAPKLARKQDSLPVMWRGMSDWIIAQVKNRRIEIQAIDIGSDNEAHYRIVALLANPLQSENATEVQGTESGAEQPEASYTSRN